MPDLNRYYLGADPGEKGALALITDTGMAVMADPVPSTARKLLDKIRGIVEVAEVAACALERIDPRPTGFKDKSGKWVQSILRSTCIIYGDCLQLHMALLAVDLDPIMVGPRDWQKEFTGPREKGKSKTSFKRDLKEIAQALFPEVHVTLVNADALLIAEWCRRKFENVNSDT